MDIRFKAKRSSFEFFVFGFWDILCLHEVPVNPILYYIIWHTPIIQNGGRFNERASQQRRTSMRCMNRHHLEGTYLTDIISSYEEQVQQRDG
jgi:hypothetical protein